MPNMFELFEKDLEGVQTGVSNRFVEYNYTTFFLYNTGKSLTCFVILFLIYIMFYLIHEITPKKFITMKKFINEKISA